MDTLIKTQTSNKSSVIEFTEEEKYIILNGFILLIKHKNYFLNLDNIKDDKHKKNAIKNKISDYEIVKSFLHKGEGLHFHQTILVLDALGFEWHQINYNLYNFFKRNKSDPIKNYKEEENLLIKRLEKVNVLKRKVFLWLYE